MLKQDFYFELPEELIAQKPLANRSDSRLLVYHRAQQTVNHSQFRQLPDLLQQGDLLVFNNSRVIPARFYGQKVTGGQVEFLLERMLNETHFLAHIKASKPLKADAIVNLDRGWQVKILEKTDSLYRCEALGKLEQMLEEIGHIPLPPYIHREDGAEDRTRYQTVYAKHSGSVAAPTAGLHFDEELFARLEKKGIEHAYTTLHVGAGTFQPVRVDKVHEHQMHSEQFQIEQNTAAMVNKALDEGRRVIAVGTTALRCLESAAKHGRISPCQRETDIFITPGYEFQICKGLITNFHLPESTLIMLVSAFIGHQQAMAMYKEAVEARYRFFSYGDASLLL